MSWCGTSTAHQGQPAAAVARKSQRGRYSRRHSLAASAVPRAQGRSWKKGWQRWQSVPAVWCWHTHTSCPPSSGAHSLAWPLHLHLRREPGAGQPL